MKPKKPSMRLTSVLKIIELSPRLRRIVVTGESLQGFPVGMEGGYVKVVIQPDSESGFKMRSYTIRYYNPEKKELALDFVINCHSGPATNWALKAKVGDVIGIAGPGPMKLTQYDHQSYLLVADITAINAINGYMPRFNKNADIGAIIAVPTRTDIIEMDYDDSVNTQWFIEDEAKITLKEKVLQTAKTMSKDTHVFLGVEAGIIRSLRPALQDELGFDRLNISAVGYWKKGVDAERFGAQKKTQPL